ncbi:MAG TPA: SIMPL domain-containing protein [Rhizomicrobium sp.]|jgi:uncharacterized protein YggE|nr:SIMPL domain-containing protein [Rhizomicrobium sp.]
MLHILRRRAAPRRLGAAAAIILLAQALSAAALADPPAPRILTVSGEGEIKTAPDAARLSTGVSTQARTAAEALSQNARAMTSVFEALKRAGVEAKNIQTSNITLQPQYAASKPGQAPRVTGYEASNTVDVAVYDLKALGPVIDALVAAGSNQIDGPSFFIADPKPFLERARKAAVEDAIAKARTLAEAAGVRLGPIQSIAEGGSESPVQPMRRMLAAAPAPTPVSAGEVEVSASVSIAWSIE